MQSKELIFLIFIIYLKTYTNTLPENTGLQVLIKSEEKIF